MLFEKIIIRLKILSAMLLIPFIRVRQNQYLFLGMGGKSIGGNPLSFLLYVKDIEPNSKLFLACNAIVDNDRNIDYIKTYSFRYYLILLSSKFIISDSRLSFPLFPIKRKNQIYVQTWHGTALKKIEAAASSLTSDYVRNAKRDSAMIDVFLSNSPFMTKIFKRDFWYSKNITEIGTPRNDIFFSNNKGKIKEKVYQKLGISKRKKILLYAPTFRNTIDSFSVYDIDINSFLESLNKKFLGEFVLVTRLHTYLLTKEGSLQKIENMFPKSINASCYDDMQELLVASDVLLTDYSSCMFDFMLTGKPCFLYVKDKETYDRGFYLDINTLPFPLASNSSALIDLVDKFDENLYANLIVKGNAYFNGSEEGNACLRLYQELHV